MEILLAAILYRLRGSDDIPITSTQVKRILWAAPVAFMVTPTWWAIPVALYLWGAVTQVEKADANWGPQPEARYGTDYGWLTLYGVTLFNPFFGLVHYLTYKFNNQLPSWPYLKGHAEWSEFINGALTYAWMMLIIVIADFVQSATF